mgnify:CR=1 FL=1
MYLPEVSHELDLRILSLETRKIRSFTPEQREIYFDNIQRLLPKQSEPFGNSLFILIPVLFNNKKFHQSAGLDYTDPLNENGQIIRVALMSYIERVFNQKDLAYTSA